MTHPFEIGIALRSQQASWQEAMDGAERVDELGWISAWPYDAAFEVDLDRVVMRRYDAGGQVLAEVAGDELFGTG